ncbi:MAG: purine-nucleoside phosphorylase [Proteobacteria bacterium]|nr:purine-nucleoside phosphorylase [Pseudomonadota bacterium]
MTEAAYQAAQAVAKAAPDFKPAFGIILGSGLGLLLQELTQPKTLLFQDLPGFPVDLIEGQKAELTMGFLQQVPVICLGGRAHYYEGCDSSHILTYVRTLKLLGCHTVIITGAVGSLSSEIKPGQLVLLKDHINFQGRNPLAGRNDPNFGERFPDMTEAYDKAWCLQMEKVAHELTISVMEGVYISVLGPTFETPAEIRLFRDFGADVVGMSVVPEVLAARHCGLRVIGLTLVTNFAAGLSVLPQSHEETLLTARQSILQMIKLLRGFMTACKKDNHGIA